MADGSTVSAVPKIQVPDFTKLITGAIKGAALDSWNKLGWQDSPYLVPGLIAVGSLITIFLLFQIYVKLVR